MQLIRLQAQLFPFQAGRTGVGDEPDLASGSLSKLMAERIMGLRNWVK
jgi:hypothetical protein